MSVVMECACKRLILAFLVVACAGAGIVRAGGSPNEDIPLDSWVYDAVFELSSLGYFDRILLHTRPYTRGEVAVGLRQIMSGPEQPSKGSMALVQRLRSEFAEELSEPDNARDAGSEYVRLGGGPNGRIDQVRHGIAGNRTGFDGIGSFGVGDVLAVRTRVRFDSDARSDTQFRGEYWKNNFTAWVDQAVMTIRYGRFHGAFGREFWRWGRSPVDAMLLSDQSPPFDGIRLSYRSSKWSFSFYATVLDSMTNVAGGTANRYLAAHRFDWRPRKNLELAVSEVIVYGGVNRPWALNYLNPFLPYYWEQLNNKTNDNPLWNIEWSWRPYRHLEIYGEWMIDDFQIDFTSEPQQIGVLAGWTWSGGPGGRLFVNGEYQRINTFVYGQVWPYNRYFHFRDLNGAAIGIGSNLGTDADRLTLRPRWHQSEHFDLTALLEYVRHGGDRIDSVQASAVPKGVPFPSGIVERRLTTALGLRWQAGGHAIFDFAAGYERVTNEANILGNDREGVLVRARLVTLFWKTMGI